MKTLLATRPVLYFEQGSDDIEAAARNEEEYSVLGF